MMAELSVVIVSLANEIDIPSARHLRNQEYEDFELIIRNDSGICRARNQGIQEASADKIVFLDDDAIPRPGYLQAADRALEDHKIVAGRVVHPRNDVISEFTNHYDQGIEPKFTDTIVGCNMGFRREVFDSVGFFDEELDWGHDETEFAERAKGEFDIYYSPDMEVEHLYADGILDYWEKMYRFGPADVYYGQKSSNTGNISALSAMFGPSAFLSESATGTIVKSIGRGIRNVSIFKSIVKQRLGKE